MSKKSTLILLSLSTLVCMVVVGWIGYEYYKGDTPPGSKFPAGNSSQIQKFGSEDAFREYLKESSATRDLNGDFIEGLIGGVPTPVPGLAEDGASGETPQPPTGSSPDPERYLVGNNQVLTVHEPTVAQTDGKSIYYSPMAKYKFIDPLPVPDRPLIDRGVEDRSIAPAPPTTIDSTIKAINASPPENLQLLNSIKGSGDLLLHENILITLDGSKVEATNVEDPQKPVQVWKYEYEKNTSFTNARLFDGNLYLLTNTYIHSETPCAIPLLEGGSDQVWEISCTDIYHPSAPVYSQSTYTVLKIEVESGDIVDTISMLESSHAGHLYMSEKNFYVTYGVAVDQFEVIYEFVARNPQLFTASVMEKIKLLNSYEISSSSKMNELNNIIDQWFAFMDGNEKLKLRADIVNEFKKYADANFRSFVSTGIARISVEDMKIEATGRVPGTVLNQFSMDEHDGHFRIATTVGGGFGRGIFSSTAQSENDIRVLDMDLKEVGSAEGMGVTERIYSARFVGDQAYLVTFRQVDPFYVVDMSDHTNPTVKGELKIPGFSSYLHPLSEDIILGIGREDGQVKLSLFDVSNPTTPQEVSKYSLNEYWTDVESNHTAFLNDPRHLVFFIPAGESGYIFSYKGDNLELKRTIAQTGADRALVINDHMYILSPESVVVLDERSWEKVGELKLD